MFEFFQEYAANYWAQKGAPRKKLIIGLGTYGRSFTLSDPNNHAVGAPASGAGPAGQYTKAKGFLSYYEVIYCGAIKAKRHIGITLSVICLSGRLSVCPSVKLCFCWRNMRSAEHTGYTISSIFSKTKVSKISKHLKCERPIPTSK